MFIAYAKTKEKISCTHAVETGPSLQIQRFDIVEILTNREILITLCGSICITKTHLYNFDPLIPHFYIVKLGFTGVYIIFLISAQKLCFEQKYEKNIRIFI